MIGGIDIHLPTRCGRSAVEVAVRAIRLRWPLAVYENGLTGERYCQFREIPFGEVEEIFVYRDPAAADQWDAEGAVPELSNTMIHLVSDADMITIVIDEKDAKMGELISAIESGLGDEIHFVKADAA